MRQCIAPGATIGVLGSGQLGRMFAIAARRLGYRVIVYSPQDDTPTGQVADVEFNSPYEDLEAVAAFADQVDVVTFEFENVPIATIDAVERVAPVQPAGQVLHTTQHRKREKSFLRSVGIPVTPFQGIQSAKDLETVTDDLVPGVLKTAAWGYDGKGQVRVNTRTEFIAAWKHLNCEEAILEKFVDFELEVSVVAVRGQDGDFCTYGPIVNYHRSHILDISIAPADLPQSVVKDAIEIARVTMESLHVVGVLCVEFFLTRDGKLLVNELAPRPHNSGHLTIDAYAACQFEQQVRAVCNLPLAAPTLLRPAAMANLLGDLWQNGTPSWSRALAFEDVKLHLYGKKAAIAGRKMGHLTALADSIGTATERVIAARNALHSFGFSGVAAT